MICLLTFHRNVVVCPTDHFDDLHGIDLPSAQVGLDRVEHGGHRHLRAGASLLEHLAQRPRDHIVLLAPGEGGVDVVLGHVLEGAAHLDQSTTGIDWKMRKEEELSGYNTKLDV